MKKVPKKIAILLQDLEVGGIQQVTLNLITALAQVPDLTVELVVVAAVGPYRSKLPKNIQLVELPMGGKIQNRLKYLVRLTYQIYRYLKAAKPDVLLSTFPCVNVFTVIAQQLAGSRTRTVLAEHTLPLNRLMEMEQGSPQNRNPDLLTTWLPRLMRWFYPHAHAIVPVSQGLAAELQQSLGLPDDQIHVVYNPVVDEALRQKAAQPLDHPWFHPGQLPVVLAVGRLTPQKDYETLLRAFQLVRQVQPVRLVILGEGESRRSMESLITQLDLTAAVAMPGFVDNPYAYMAHAAVLVLSSIWEILPTVLIEAMACGCPVVSTDCDYGPAEILDQGTYGRLVPIRDVQALADALLATLQDPPPVEQLHTRAEDFSVETSVNAYLNLLGIR